MLACGTAQWEKVDQDRHWTTWKNKELKVRLKLKEKGSSLCAMDTAGFNIEDVNLITICTDNFKKLGLKRSLAAVKESQPSVPKGSLIFDQTPEGLVLLHEAMHSVPVIGWEDEEDDLSPEFSKSKYFYRFDHTKAN
jgi:hypothetical protein